VVAVSVTDAGLHATTNNKMIDDNKEKANIFLFINTSPLPLGYSSNLAVKTNKTQPSGCRSPEPVHAGEAILGNRDEADCQVGHDGQELTNAV
jgi:hypothetical protein